jgi:glycosyltransferase involved in cell wall biosynthesis
VASILISLEIIQCVNKEKREGGVPITHIHTSSYTGFYEKIFFVLIARSLGSRVILHIHGGAFNHFFEENGRVTQQLISRLLLLPDRLIVLSEWWANFFRERVNPELEGRITVLHNAVEVPNLSLDRLMRARSGSEQFRIVFLGSVGDRKGCRELLGAADQLSAHSDIQIYFLGGGEQDGDLERYKRKSHEMGLSDVQFPGYVSGDQKAEYMKKADMFVLPSRADNFPISLLEAMSYGLPVVVSDVGAMDEVVSKENGIVISPRDTDGLVEAIQFMYNHPDQRKEMGQKNVEKVVEHYSASQYINYLESIYL